MKKIALSVLLLLVILFSCNNRDGEIIDLINSVKKQNDDLKAQITALKKTTDSALVAVLKVNALQTATDKKIDLIQTDLKSLLTQIGTLTSQMTSTNADLVTLKAKIDALQAKCAELVAQIALLNASIVPTLKTDLIAYYSFTGNALDQSGNGNHGKVLGSPQLTTDRYNNANSAYSFSTANAGFGTQNQEINIPFNPTFNTKTITVAAWVNPITYGWSGNTPDYSVIISRFQDGYSNPNGQVWTLTCQTTKIESYILNASSANNQTNTLVASPTPIPLNKWSHVAITYDGNTLKLYINGELIQSKTSGLILNTLSSSGISIGESFNANGYWNPFNGKIDDVAIYGRALGETEMKSLYNSQGLY